MIGTVISGNYAKPRPSPFLSKGQPTQFIVAGVYAAQMNITGLQYKNHNGGIYLILGSPKTDPGPFSTLFLKDSCFENNEYFSMNVFSGKIKTLQMRRLLFRGNTFLNSTLQCFGINLVPRSQSSVRECRNVRSGKVRYNAISGWLPELSNALF